MTAPIGPKNTPFDILGEERARALAARFYDHMDATERALAQIHVLDDDGRVHARTRARFADFLVEWLGGPPAFSTANGHPRLRMRHAHVAVDEAMRDAWLRCMKLAMDDVGIDGDLRGFLDRRFAELADFLRNR